MTEAEDTMAEAAMAVALWTHFVRLGAQGPEEAIRRYRELSPVERADWAGRARSLLGRFALFAAVIERNGTWRPAGEGGAP